MIYIKIDFLEKNAQYLAIFLPLLLIGYSTMPGSANALPNSNYPNEIKRVDDGGLPIQLREGIGWDQGISQKILKPEYNDLKAPPPLPSPPRGWTSSKTKKEAEAQEAAAKEAVAKEAESKAFLTAPTKWIIMDPPIKSPRVTFPESSTGKDITRAWVQIPNKDKLNMLNNTRAEISVGQVNASGEFSYLVAKSTGSIGNYRVIMDYTPYLVDSIISSSTNKKIGDARVGLGLRLTADITTKTADINLSSLMALGVAAKLNQIEGSMYVDTIGIRIENSGIILSSTTIDETSILKALETLAVMQSKIGDKTTYLEPQFIWVKPISNEVKRSELMSSLQKIEQSE